MTNIDPTSQPGLEITTVDGSSDLSHVEPTDHVVAKAGPDARGVLLSAGTALTADKQPLATAEDGSVPLLDSSHAVKLGGEVLAIAEAHPDQPQ